MGATEQQPQLLYTAQHLMHKAVRMPSAKTKRTQYACWLMRGGRLRICTIAVFLLLLW